MNAVITIATLTKFLSQFPQDDRVSGELRIETEEEKSWHLHGRVKIMESGTEFLKI